ncbi:4-hydroxy-tetrahydrodipicolinate synthase [Taurinivorans muris]|uniref:4-hydroxy-tetrahydrodipicolinate synthase n=1 Tax=Taurinivorans muris TaxID=2787751 RepID=A0ABY5XZR2_9BACT|nr:4-hydroxy-tetrahydrodipicolinate synthase [Desulfovibrionaceae bacterium LT0009]
MLKGAISALVLPFKNGHIDEEAYREFIEWQIEQGIDGLVPCGTTGESATLSHEEHEKAIRICIEQAKKRVPVIAGCGSNNTAEAVRLTQFAKSAGADAALLISPYYNKPTQEGIFLHYQAVSREVSFPFLVYNVPGRTGSNVTAETMARMYHQIPDMIGVKEATGNLVQISNMLEKTDENFILLSGDDSTVLATLALGGKGTISVTSNVMPKKVHELCEAWEKGNANEAKRLHYYLEPLNRAMFVETNPIPVKTALFLMGKMSAEFRLPLCDMREATLAVLKKIMQDMKLI